MKMTHGFHGSHSQEVKDEVGHEGYVEDTGSNEHPTQYLIDHIVEGFHGSHSLEFIGTQEGNLFCRCHADCHLVLVQILLEFVSVGHCGQLAVCVDELGHGLVS